MLHGWLVGWFNIFRLKFCMNTSSQCVLHAQPTSPSLCLLNNLYFWIHIFWSHSHSRQILIAKLLISVRVTLHRDACWLSAKWTRYRRTVWDPTHFDREINNVLSSAKWTNGTTNSYKLSYGKSRSRTWLFMWDYDWSHLMSLSEITAVSIETRGTLTSR